MNRIIRDAMGNRYHYDRHDLQFLVDALISAGG
jgi:hypothetical protein